MRITILVVRTAGDLLPVELRSLDALHLATVAEFGDQVARVVTYDVVLLLPWPKRMGRTVAAPA